MKKGFLVLILTLLSMNYFVSISSAADEAISKGVKISGFVDAYYSLNLNRPDTNTNTIGGTTSNFDFSHNTFSLNLAELVVSKTADPVGFRIDLDFGPTTDFVHCGNVSCAAVDDFEDIDNDGVVDTNELPSSSREETFKNIQQAYVTWATPTGVTLDFGKFVTHMGAEVIESKDNWNYTRGLLFCCAIPYYHSGLKANYVISDTLFVNGYILNGWNNVFENNNSKTFGAQIGITPIKQLPILLNWVGPEDSTGAFENRQVYDLVVTYNATDSLSFMINYDYGTQDLLPTGDQKWSGIAAYARWAGVMSENCAVAIRYENVDDKDDFMFLTGKVTGQKVQEITLTGEHKVAGNILLRLEYRHDMADEDIFSDEGGNFTDTQDRVIVGVIYSF